MAQRLDAMNLADIDFTEIVPGPFHPVTLDEWREAVAGAVPEANPEQLAVKNCEGITIDPVYATEVRPSELPGSPSYRRGNTVNRHAPGWDIGWSLDGRLDCDTESIRSLLDLDVKLFGIDVTPGPQFAETLAALVQHGATVCFSPKDHIVCLPGHASRAAREAAVPLREIAGSFGLDPVGELARTGNGVNPGQHAAVLRDVAKWTSEHMPCFRSITVDTGTYHSAGARAALELAVAVATGIHYLRLLAGGMSTGDSADQIGFSFPIATDFFMEVAKLRAARILWSNVLMHSRVTDIGGVHILAYSSGRAAARYGRWTNIPRESGACFAAITGGADGIILYPYDRTLSEPSRAARRLALTTQHILAQETRAGTVQDPAGGSWYLERLTDELAARAWDMVRDIEGRGGIEGCLRSGYVQSMIAGARAARSREILHRKTILVGVNAFVDPEEGEVGRKPPALEQNRLALRENIGLEERPEPSPGGQLSTWVASHFPEQPGMLDSCALEADGSAAPPELVEALLPASDAAELEGFRDRVERVVRDTTGPLVLAQIPDGPDAESVLECLRASAAPIGLAVVSADRPEHDKAALNSSRSIAVFRTSGRPDLLTDLAPRARAIIVTTEPEQPDPGLPVVLHAEGGELAGVYAQLVTLLEARIERS